MSLLKRLFGKKESSEDTGARSRPTRTRADMTKFVDGGAPLPELVQLAGTTTMGRDAAARLAARHDPSDGGYLELGGVIQREPNNPVDPHAVMVLVEGERIGYLPGYVAKMVDMSEKGARPVRVQIFTQLLQSGLRVEAWAWLGSGYPSWQWSQQNPPPLSPAAKRLAQQRQTDEMVKGALAGGDSRAAQFRAGMVNGVHYLQLVEPIKQLKREGRLEEALELCSQAIQAAENAARQQRTLPPPWYTEQAAIIHRKLKQRNAEIAVLQRYVDACPTGNKESALKARLDKLVGP